MTSNIERERLAPAPRPWEVTLLVILGYIGGAFNIATGIFVMVGFDDDELLAVSVHSEGELIAIGLLAVLLGLVQIVLANMLGKGSNAVRVLYAVVASLNLAIGLWATIALHGEQRATGIGAAVLALFVLWLLFNRKSEEFFETN